jgi:hypothetical protein
MTDRPTQETVRRPGLTNRQQVQRKIKLSAIALSVVTFVGSLSGIALTGIPGKSAQPVDSTTQATGSLALGPLAAQGATIQQTPSAQSSAVRPQTQPLPQVQARPQVQTQRLRPFGRTRGS